MVLAGGGVAVEKCRVLEPDACQMFVLRPVVVIISTARSA